MTCKFIENQKSKIPTFTNRGNNNHNISVDNFKILYKEENGFKLNLLEYKTIFKYNYVYYERVVQFALNK